MNALVPILVGVGALVFGLFAGYVYRRNIAEAKIARAEDAVKHMIDDAQKKSEALKKETILEAKEEVLRLRNEFEKEIRERRIESQRTERRLLQREEALDKKMDAIESKESHLSEKQKEMAKMQDTISAIHQQQLEELERISNMTLDEAKDVLLVKVEQEARHDAAVIVKDIETKAKEEAEKKARNIIGVAIQKYAADHVAETTVTAVPLPTTK